MRQMSFITLAQKKKLKCERFLDEMKQVIPWERLLAEIVPYYQEQQQGRKKKELLLMLKIYFLQQWYGLSDPGMEEAIYDRASFQKFLEIDLLTHGVPMMRPPYSTSTAFAGAASTTEDTLLLRKPTFGSKKYNSKSRNHSRRHHNRSAIQHKK